MNTTPSRSARLDALDEILIRDAAHHLEINYEDDGSVYCVTAADLQWCEIASYERDELTDEERRDAESLYAPEGALYPDTEETWDESSPMADGIDTARLDQIEAQLDADTLTDDELACALAEAGLPQLARAVNRFADRAPS